MPHIVLDDEQVKIITESVAERIEIRDRNGRHLGYVSHGFTDDEIAAAKLRMTSDEPRFTTEQVLNHIHALEQR